MSSSLRLNRINIPQLSHATDGGRVAHCCTPSEPPSAAGAVPPPRPPPPRWRQSAARTEDIDNANRIGRRRADNNARTCSHHCHHSRGGKYSNDSNWSRGTATKGTVYTLPPSSSLPPPPPSRRHSDQHTDTSVRGGGRAGVGAGAGAGAFESTCRGIHRRRRADDSVQCASATGDTHHHGDGTLTTTAVGSNFNCVSTLRSSGRVTCAVQPQPRPLECVHRRCHPTTAKRSVAAAPAPASSIQDPSQTDITLQPKTLTDIGKHFCQALDTNTEQPITTTSATTTSWASTSTSVSSPPSVQDFAKCLTAEEKSTPPENSLAKGPLSANPCDFVLSELYFSPFGDIFCYNLCPGAAAVALGVPTAASSLQGLLSDSLGHFCSPQRIFLVANQATTTHHPHWLGSNNQRTDSVQKYNFLILSACNLNSVLLFVNNELVRNLNENSYFSQSTSPLSSLSLSSPSSPSSSSSSLSSSSSREGAEAEAEGKAKAETSAAAAEAVNLKGTFCKSFTEQRQATTVVGVEEESKDSSHCKAISDVPRRQTSPTTTNSSTTSTRQHVLDIRSCGPPKASHSLLKVSDVQKNSDSNNNNTTSTNTTSTAIIHTSSSNNINNDNEQQCINQGTTVKPSSSTLVTDKTQPNNSHFVEENAFKASQRLKRLEENFKGLTIVRKVIEKRQPINGNVSENRLTNLTRSQQTNQQPLTFQPSSSEAHESGKREQNEPVDKDVNNSSSSPSPSPSPPESVASPSSLSCSVLLEEEEDVKSSTTSVAITPSSNDNESITKTSSFPHKNSNLSDSNNNLNLPTPSSDSSCPIGSHSNNNLHRNVNDSSASFVNTSSSSSRKKDIFYITRPPLSISEFDVRQLNDIRFDRKADHFLTLECYDELLYDDDQGQDEYAPQDINISSNSNGDDEVNSIELPAPSSRPVSVNTSTTVTVTPGDNECDADGFDYVSCNCQKRCCATLNQDDLSSRVQIPPPTTNSVISNLKQFGGGRCNATPARTPAPTPAPITTNSSHSTVDFVFDIEMREINGQLRGLLKKPNRPPPARKNRVVFDETRNEFFEADYIILIREDCAYDEEDEEPCTCGEHELVRLCCEEGCQCNYTNEDTRTPQSPKFAPPIEFVDEAALSPPDGYKDNGLKNTLGGALSGHIFGAQHIQQLQVIQRLQQQRAAMLAARNTNQGPQPPLPPATAAVTPAATAVAGQQPAPTGPAAPAPGQAAQLQQPQPQPPPSQSQSQLQPHSPDDDSQTVCTECAECVECAAKQLQESECTSPQCQEEVAQLSVPTVALVPLHSSSPERRITQKEIIAGEERPKYILQAQYKPASVTERRIVREASEDITATSTTATPQVILQTAAAAMAAGTAAITQPVSSITAVTAAAATPATALAGIGVGPGITAAPGPPPAVSEPVDLIPEPKPPIPPKESSPTQISGILKGGKLWKQESISQSDDMNTSSEDDTNAKRSVRFVTEDTMATSRDGDGQAAPDSPEHDSQINELIPIKKHSTLFTNALRPNSAVRQLFPSAVQTSSMLTHEALRAFDESKRAGNLLPNLVGGNPGDSDTVRRSIERNILRRSLIKKKAVKSDISLEERIKLLTCDIDESNEDPGQDSNDENGGKVNSLNGEPVAHRDSPTGEENPQQKYSNDKSFSPSSSVSSSSSGSSSAYKKISDIFNRDKKQEKIMEMEENPIVIIPQECRCPAAPDLGMGIQVPVVHTQIHRTPPRQTEPKRQFLSTLAPLTACVAGQKDDLSYYTLAAAEGNSPANTHFAQYSMGDLEPVLCNDEMRKVAPDVIAGTPGQEQDELAAFAQQEANRTEKIKKRYTNETSNASSDDDEQNDYGFNKRPSVRGIKPKFSSTNEILQQMQDQLNKSMPSIQNNAPIKSYTLPKQASSSSINSQLQNVQQQNPQIPAATAISQQQTERTWSFYGDPEQQRIPMDGNMHPGYYHTMPTVFQQTFQGQEETLMYQNCVTMEQHYGRYARSPTRRPESPPPLRNYHQTMVLIPYNAETYSQFAATNVDPKVAQIQRQNILEYQQVTQQTIRVPISYALPAMQLHVVAGRGHATQQYVQHQQQHIPPQQQNQRILAPRYSMPQDGTMGFSERGVPEGAAAVSHTDCKGIVSPTSQTSQPPQQQQQQQQMQSNCNQSTVTSTGPPGSVFYAMNV